MSEPVTDMTAEAVDPVSDAIASLKEQYGDELTDDPRPHFTGLMVPAGRLLDVAKTLREELGFNYLSSVTGVDLLKEDKMEVVYHTYSIDQGGGAVVLKVQVDRSNPVVPSLTPTWPGADFQEREAWDLLGIRFEGHPDLRRILMWEGFEGHPLRKDWKEPFYEEDQKPFGTRWPGGDVYRIEELNPYGRNVRYPAGWNADEVVIDTDSEIYAGMTVTPGSADMDGYGHRQFGTAASVHAWCIPHGRNAQRGDRGRSETRHGLLAPQS